MSDNLPPPRSVIVVAVRDEQRADQVATELRRRYDADYEVRLVDSAGAAAAALPTPGAGCWWSGGPGPTPSTRRRCSS
jgi:hypothetical protein